MLRWRKGMAFGEFQNMLDEHCRELDTKPVSVTTDCVHPFDVAGMVWEVKNRDGTLLLTVSYKCTTCGEHAGASTKRLRPRKGATAALSGQACR